VTPALNAGRFIARTLDSVRAQRYPHIEHIVVDGGSVDETPDLVTAAGSARLLVVPGLRQAEAVNRGVAESRGEALVVLNADDILYADGVTLLVAALTANHDVAAAYGDAVHVDENERVLSRYPTRAFDRDALLESCYICQPASAIRRTAFEAEGGMNTRLEVALDYDLWIRLARRHTFQKVEGVVAASRMHRENKTLARRGEVFREALQVLRAHYGYVPYSWSYAYASWLLHRKDGFFEPPPQSRAAVVASLGLGLWLNRTRPRRYFDDWYGHRSAARR
jgi:glycosyltransferase involved in cell wall biosynthesis